MISADSPPLGTVKVFQVRSHVASPYPFKDADTVEAEAHLLDVLAEAPPGTTVLVDFSGVQIASAAARQLLKRALLRLRSGEFQDRYLVLGDLGDSEYSVVAMLVSESLTAIERTIDHGPRLIGIIEPAIQETYRYLVSTLTATASVVQEHFGLNNISTATNRLTALMKLGLARRVERRPVSGGGREYVYAAVQ